MPRFRPVVAHAVRTLRRFGTFARFAPVLEAISKSENVLQLFYAESNLDGFKSATAPTGDLFKAFYYSNR